MLPEALPDKNSLLEVLAWYILEIKDVLVTE